MQGNNTQKMSYKVLKGGPTRDWKTIYGFFSFFFPPFLYQREHTGEADKINCGNSVNANSIFIYVQKAWDLKYRRHQGRPLQLKANPARAAFLCCMPVSVLCCLCSAPWAEEQMYSDPKGEG